MRVTRKSLSTLPLALLAMAALPTGAEAKCLERAGSPILPGYVLIVDGERIGEYAMDAQADMPPSDEILVMEVTCLRAESAPNPNARQAATVVITRRGAPRLLQSYLRDLVEAQKEFHSIAGAYAEDLEELSFLESHIAIPMAMEVGDGGWFAAATIPGSNSTCHVAVGSATRDPRFQRGPRTSGGKPVCYQT